MHIVMHAARKETWCPLPTGGWSNGARCF